MSPPQEDYYAVLQVQPDAEPEVIEAAYRQLMRKYHPDVAGVDRERAATLHERAKSLNRAYAVLRDPRQRRVYDRRPGRRGGESRPPPSSSHSATDAWTAAAPASPGARATSASRGAGAAEVRQPASAKSGSRGKTADPGPRPRWLASLSNLYYFLPGPYEWERERDKDLLATLMVPPLGVASWSLASGRLAGLTGHAPYVGWFAWALLAMLALPLWSALPRLLLAGVPTMVLVTGQVGGLLRLASVPTALAWIGVSAFGIAVSARLYLFGVLPTLMVCWLLANAGPALGALGSALAALSASVSNAELGVLTLASLLGVLTWVTVLTWDRPSASARAASAAPPADVTPPRPEAAAVDPNQPLFRRISADRVQAMQTVPLRTDRDRREPPSCVVDAKQEANVLLVRDPWAFLQTDDGREGWAEWSVAS